MGRGGDGREDAKGKQPREEHGLQDGFNQVTTEWQLGHRVAGEKREWMLCISLFLEPLD